jgi:hypothetical protein
VQVSEVMEVHCGFCGDGNIFSMDQEDKVYLQSCEIAVLTCNFGGGDDIYQPINMTRLSLFKVQDITWQIFLLLWFTEIFVPVYMVVLFSPLAPA